VNARNALLSVSALMATTLASCGTLNRAGKDLMLGIGTPVLMVYGGATDGVTSAQNVRTGLDSGSPVEVLAFPFTFLYHAIEHGIYGVVHIVDFFAFPLYGAAELHPYGPEIMPLDIYQGTFFDTWAEEHRQRRGTDAESGEMVPATTTTTTTTTTTAN
jgi:predicted small secreted protein